MAKPVQDLREIKIVPNEKGGVQLFVNGEKIDLKDTTNIHLDLCHDEENNLIFELTAKKEIDVFD